MDTAKIDPVIEALFLKLPPIGAEFSLVERLRFLRTLEATFKLIYKDDEAQVVFNRVES